MMDNPQSQPLKFVRPSRFKVLWLVGRASGWRGILRMYRGGFQDWLQTLSPVQLLWLSRVHQLGLVGIGFCVFYQVSLPSSGSLQANLVMLVRSIALTGIGAAVALKGLIGFVATFSVQLLVSGFKVSLVPSLLRTAIVFLVACVGMFTPWPENAWWMIGFSIFLWVLWPLVLNLTLAVRLPTPWLGRSASLDRMLSMASRKLPLDQRNMIAHHEAGHAVFFGLGTAIPEDLYAWLSDDAPNLERMENFNHMLAGGAVSAFGWLAEKSYLFDRRQPELLAYLGLFCGGAAAEEVFVGKVTVSAQHDFGVFEIRARQYLTIFPEFEFPYLAAPETEAEVALNARSLIAFRQHLTRKAIEFIKTNECIVRKIAEALLDKGELDVEDLRRLLFGTQAAGGFERFEWPASVPSMGYLETS